MHAQGPWKRSRIFRIAPSVVCAARDETDLQVCGRGGWWPGWPRGWAGAWAGGTIDLLRCWAFGTKVGGGQRGGVHVPEPECFPGGRETPRGGDSHTPGSHAGPICPHTLPSVILWGLLAGSGGSGETTDHRPAPWGVREHPRAGRKAPLGAWPWGEHTRGPPGREALSRPALPSGDADSVDKPSRAPASQGLTSEEVLEAAGAQSPR